MTADDGAGGDRKRSSSGSAKDQQASPKKRKTKVFDINLPNAPVDGKFSAVVSVLSPMWIPGLVCLEKLHSVGFKHYSKFLIIHS